MEQHMFYHAQVCVSVIESDLVFSTTQTKSTMTQGCSGPVLSPAHSVFCCGPLENGCDRGRVNFHTPQAKGMCLSPGLAVVLSPRQKPCCCMDKILETKGCTNL